MTHIEFFPFHNRHIKFRLRNGQELHGVLLDMMDYNNKKVHTEYIFIPTERMREWKEADTTGNVALKEQLQSIIDIENIESAELLNF